MEFIQNHISVPQHHAILVFIKLSKADPRPNSYLEWSLHWLSSASTGCSPASWSRPCRWNRPCSVSHNLADLRISGLVRLWYCDPR